jgi:hypothetical protein
MFIDRLRWFSSGVWVTTAGCSEERTVEAKNYYSMALTNTCDEAAATTSLLSNLIYEATVHHVVPRAKH